MSRFRSGLSLNGGIVMGSRFRFVLLVLAGALGAGAVPACGGSASSRPDGGGGGGDTTPITERTMRPRYQCRVDRGLTPYAPTLWSPWPTMTTGGSGQAYLGRVES